MAGYQGYRSHLLLLLGRCTCTAHKSLRGSQPAPRKSSFSVHIRDVRMATPFAEAYPSAFPGSERNPTTPMRRPTDLYAQKRGGLSRSCSAEVRLRSACSRRATKAQSDGGRGTFVSSIVRRSGRNCTSNLSSLITEHRQCASRRRCIPTTEWDTFRWRDCTVWTKFIIWTTPTRTAKRCSTATLRSLPKPTA